MLWILSNVTNLILIIHSTGGFRFSFVSLEIGWAEADCLAARVAHSAVADSSEEPALTEGTEITTHSVRRFTVSPQWKAVSGRRRPFLHTEFLLLKREGESNHDL